MGYKIVSQWQPCGDQPQAIKDITQSFQNGHKEHTLLGVTGSGKTFTVAHVISQLQQPALVIAPNKTLAGQLFMEFREFFPENSVDFFISYYDYYQPEAYVPSTDTYIAKDASINEDIDKMRHMSTQNLFEKSHSIIVASVSCIYGLGSPKAYSDLALQIRIGEEYRRRDFLQKLLDIRYERDDVNLRRGYFRVRGEVLDILPAHEKSQAIRVEFFGDEIERIALVDALTGTTVSEVKEICIYPNSHYIAAQHDMKIMIRDIQDELRLQLQYFQSENKLVEYQRLEQRVLQDIEYFEHLGYCPGVENYSRYLTGAQPGKPPATLIDYFPENFITIIDESHLTVPQLRAMYRGDRSRKENLVNFGFRLPSALDNRPLRFEEFEEKMDKVLYVSATPGPYELERTADAVSEQIIRPTGLVDPEIEVLPASNQIDDLYAQIQKTIPHGKVFVLTLTKKISEDLTKYYEGLGVKVRYLHSNIDTLERSDLLRDLRQGAYDVLIGINLLREGLDLPEVSLVAILDADKEGFLRSKNSLIQMVGRAARNAHGRVIFYADHRTKSMDGAIQETGRRRKLQNAYNRKHHIQPKSVSKDITDDLRTIYNLSSRDNTVSSHTVEHPLSSHEINKLIHQKERKMKKAAGQLDFEKAQFLKQEIAALKKYIS